MVSTAIAEPEPPTPEVAGTFAIYATPDGGYCLVTDIPGRGVEQRVISGKMVRFAMGPGARMLGNLFGKGD